jgi:hypothetical protein
LQGFFKRRIFGGIVLPRAFGRTWHAKTLK